MVAILIKIFGVLLLLYGFSDVPLKKGFSILIGVILLIVGGVLE